MVLVFLAILGKILQEKNSKHVGTRENITQTNLNKFIVIDYFQLKFLSSLRNNYDTLFVYCF